MTVGSAHAVLSKETADDNVLVLWLPGSPHDSEGSLSLRLSHGPLFSPLAFAVPATQTERGSLTQRDASACQGCSDQAHRESEPLIVTFKRSSQRELRRASLDQREREASVLLVIRRIEAAAVQKSIPEEAQF